MLCCAELCCELDAGRTVRSGGIGKWVIWWERGGGVGVGYSNESSWVTEVGGWVVIVIVVGGQLRLKMMG